MNTTIPGPHLTEAEIIRALDRQLEPTESVRVETHLQGCDACRTQLDRAGLRTHRLADLLRATDYELPPIALPQPDPNVIDLAANRAQRGPRSGWLPQQPWLRAAAGIVLLLAAVFSITPVRAAIVEWARTQWGRNAGTDTAPPAPPRAPAAAPAPAGPRIEFSPASTEFRLELMQPDVQAKVSVRRAAGDQAIVEASSPDAEPIVLTDGVRVNNQGTVAVTYTVELPVSVRTMILVIPGRGAERISAERIDAGVTLTGQ
jgi:hypothetical protein